MDTSGREDPQVLAMHWRANRTRAQFARRHNNTAHRHEPTASGLLLSGLVAGPQQPPEQGRPQEHEGRMHEHGHEGHMHGHEGRSA